MKALKSGRRTQSSPVNWRHALILGLLVALSGLLALAIPAFSRLEADVGLNWLFKLRGARPAPSQVVVVTIDLESSRELGLPNVPRKWPRGLHARLLDNLVDAGARVVGFDMIFSDPQAGDQDRLFAEAIERAGNVILFEYLQNETLDTGNSEQLTAVHLERRYPPLPVFTSAALAVAPFVLPKIPQRIGQTWLFKPGAGDIPTIPMVALHHFLGLSCETFKTMVARVAALPAVKRRCEGDHPGIYAGVLRDYVRQHRDQVSQFLKSLVNSSIADSLIADSSLANLSLEAKPVKKSPTGKSVITSTDSNLAARKLQVLLGAHLLGDSMVLDLYGPARLITTVSYHRVLAGDSPVPLAGKAVFVGFSERLQPEQQDSFYTAFSNEDGLDISGVELMATAFANLLEKRSVQLPSVSWIWLVGLFGLIVGALLYLVPGRIVILLTASLSGAYLWVCWWLFADRAIWLPVMAPLVVQMPMALVVAQFAHYILAQGQRRQLHEAFSHYVPEHVVSTAAHSDLASLRDGENVYAVCLATDVTEYTRFSEQVSPAQLHGQLNEYFEQLFTPVQNNHGLVVDVVGDAMLALWSGGNVHDLRQSACLTAVQIQRALDNSLSGLPTRIGLHCGDVSLGNVGSHSHYEYRAVGDTVNTTVRIESLNKQLDTRILATKEVIEGIAGIAKRPIGQFRLKGKQHALTLYEIFSAPIPDQQASLFAEALACWQDGRWERACAMFQQLVKNYPNDGPARFYVAYLVRGLANGDSVNRDGIIDVTIK